MRVHCQYMITDCQYVTLNSVRKTANSKVSHLSAKKHLFSKIRKEDTHVNIIVFEKKITTRLNLFLALRFGG